MTVYITIRSTTAFLDILFPYLDKVFQIIFNDYDILVNKFWKYEFKTRADIGAMMWAFDGEKIDWDDVLVRIQRAVPQMIDCDISRKEPLYLDDYKEVK